MKLELELTAADCKALRRVRKDEEFMQLCGPMKEVTDAELALALLQMACKLEQEDKGFEYLEGYINAIKRKDWK